MTRTIGVQIIVNLPTEEQLVREMTEASLTTSAMESENGKEVAREER